MTIINSKAAAVQKKAAGWLIPILIFAYPVSSFVSVFLGVESSIISIAARVFTLMAVIVYAFIVYWYRLFIVYRISFYLFMLFWALYLPRLIHDIYLHSNQLGIPDVNYLLFGIFLSFLMSIPLFAYCDYDEAIIERRVFAIASTLSIFCLYFALTDEQAFVERVGGNTKLNPITTGIIVLLSATISLRRILFKGKLPIHYLVFHLLNILIALVVFILASTKSMIILLVAFVIYFLIRQFFSRSILPLIALLGIFISIGVAIYNAGLGDIFEITVQRFINIREDESSQGRVDLINGAINQFVESPLIGSFIEERIMQMYPHNVVLEALMAIGILGGLLMAVLFVIFLWQSIAVARATNLGVLSILAVVQVMLAMVSSSICFSPEMWYMMAIISSKSLNPFEKEVVRSNKKLMVAA